MRVELSMLLGGAELYKLLRRAANLARRHVLRRHEDLGRIFRLVQPPAT